MTEPDWLNKPLSDLTVEQWEMLCDGCGKCCMAKLQDAETEKVYFTNIACRLLDVHTCRCKDYAHRTARVPDCVALSLDRPHEFEWLPKTCAYRLRIKQQPLPDWHPLRTGDANSVHASNISVKGRTVQQRDAGPLEHHIVDWL